MPAAAASICQLKCYGSSGVGPRGAQRRTRCGRSLNPLASPKIMVRRALFLRRGQSTCFPRRLASSARSRARPAGR